MRTRLLSFVVLFSLSTSLVFAQGKATRKDSERWQQHANYFMEIDMDVNTNRFQGTQKIKYTNNSPDVLDQVFYHLYFNAFQPGSMMDVRSRTIEDPDRRVRDRISKLSEDEIGYQKIFSLKQDGKDVKYEVEGTVLEVELAKPIQPGQTVTFDMTFEGQVPVQIRRSGRDNAEGVRYTMTQWFPKLAEYDYQGWHADEYIGREFYGIWGDYDVKISIDKDYVIGGTGYLQNPLEIGHGYEDAGQTVKKKVKDGKLTWHFKAPNVHDFAWAADPDYVHDKLTMDNGMVLHFFHQKGQNEKNWKELMPLAEQAFEYANEHFGQYPYKQFSVIQGGDGGMEYPMSTMITGMRGSLLGVTIHEAMHDWYHGVLGNNEALTPWMDEGFTSYASARISRHIRANGKEEEPTIENLGMAANGGYLRIAMSGVEEPLSTHGDHYNLNGAYSAASYSKGSVWMSQLGYVIGEEALDKGLLEYFDTWKFKHPNPNDVLRVFERVSGLELDWYNEYFVYTTKKIDYGIQNVVGEGNSTKVTLEKVGLMPMPTDVVVTYKDGTKEVHYMALRMMRGEKPAETNDPRVVHPDWPWTHPTYEFSINKPVSEIASIEIDPSKRMADVNRENNAWTAEALDNKK
ncbi:MULTISPECIES: M1 family metallopeptidase [Roseivirga]|uniref:Peptidase M1 n=1 Tax=Roseivirga spongicola TaxID=333140 RepID=A0A150WZ87_9BACT|nr:MULTISPECIES: M1 family metallopeptidase [Roseivirga]KYG71801.1 peptidase M1 [Roseivirga spongicola]MBO6662222.1 M1 family metallopeptidase [Roseivirga sp.]MBO6760314.1 M1 family metallopeptidase [Roseivirga sp.]MBO6910050.1 M1 family metallopeptidase [Roseivirga sp.]WPZ08930.1 M1 family metallopeptidase [Roseivirga spongicola]